MCGIGGLFSWELFSPEQKKKVRDITAKMLVETQKRGADATGVATINTFTDGVNYYKKGEKASLFIGDKNFDKLMLGTDYNLVLIHCRASTKGSPKNPENNHPIYSKATNSVLIHNGIIYNDVDLAKANDIKQDGEVDSEIILRMYEKCGIDKMIKEVAGSMAIALYHKKKQYLYRHNNPLEMGYVKELDVVLFSSDIDYIKSALSQEEKFYGLFKSRSMEYDLASYTLSQEELMTIKFEKKSIKRREVKAKEYVLSYKFDKSKDTIQDTLFKGYDKENKGYWGWEGYL